MNATPCRPDCRNACLAEQRAAAEAKRLNLGDL